MFDFRGAKLAPGQQQLCTYCGHVLPLEWSDGVVAMADPSDPDNGVQLRQEFDDYMRSSPAVVGTADPAQTAPRPIIPYRANPSFPAGAATYIPARQTERKPAGRRRGKGAASTGHVATV